MPRTKAVKLDVNIAVTVKSTEMKHVTEKRMSIAQPWVTLTQEQVTAKRIVAVMIHQVAQKKAAAFADGTNLDMDSCCSELILVRNL